MVSGRNIIKKEKRNFHSERRQKNNIYRQEVSECSRLHSLFLLNLFLRSGSGRQVQFPEVGFEHDESQMLKTF